MYEFKNNMQFCHHYNRFMNLFEEKKKKKRSDFE